MINGSLMVQLDDDYLYTSRLPVISLQDSLRIGILTIDMLKSIDGYAIPVPSRLKSVVGDFFIKCL